ncbi:hypothetical protein FACS1894200_04740 [Spirochaetia bacterium]|nr:hypothetical protein FACS1894200_04740 [Spirochaetia bacterium]
MPCIQKWHQESQNGQKKEYIEGHCWGFIGALICGIGRCIPLMGRIHESKVKTGGNSIIEQMLEMAGKIAKNRGKAAIMVLDA